MSDKDEERVKSKAAGKGSPDAIDLGAKNGDQDVAEGGEGDKLEEAKAEAARLKDQLLRTAADYDNFRKRSRREIDDAQKRGREELLRELLPVFDNLERAMLHAGQSNDAKAVAEGVGFVVKQFVDTLGKIGIRRISTVGVPFDPNQHEAIQQVESNEHPPGTVVAEVQPGYALGDRLVRAAMVVVSKGPHDEGSRPAN
ncbi:MAG TPA: nucleotide exchange factor GrpE [Polyangiaceae bacterium]|jgi:molecular chaperone GrpE